jgi:hypothetical protein
MSSRARLTDAKVSHCLYMCVCVSLSLAHTTPPLFAVSTILMEPTAGQLFVGLVIGLFIGGLAGVLAKHMVRFTGFFIEQPVTLAFAQLVDPEAPATGDAPEYGPPEYCEGHYYLSEFCKDQYGPNAFPTPHQLYFSHSEEALCMCHQLFNLRRDHEAQYYNHTLRDLLPHSVLLQLPEDLAKIVWSYVTPLPVQRAPPTAFPVTGMFYSAAAFDQPLGDWVVSSVWTYAQHQIRECVEELCDDVTPWTWKDGSLVDWLGQLEMNGGDLPIDWKRQEEHWERATAQIRAHWY